MSMNLNIPITQTITLPDSWQACKTPQELSYWIIAKFEVFTSSISEINSALTELGSMIKTNTDNIATNDAEIAEIKTSIANINTSIGEINTSIETLNNDYGLLHSNYMAMNNRLATVEDIAGDIPTIKNDITELQTNVNTNTTNITTNTTNIATNTNSIENIKTKNEGYDFALGKIQTKLGVHFFENSTEKIYSMLKINETTTTIINSSMDYRQFIDISPNTENDPGLSFTIYYNSDYNVPFGHYDTSISGTDITTAMESYSIDGSITLNELLAKTKVVIKFFRIGPDTNKKFSWAVL